MLVFSPEKSSYSYAACRNCISLNRLKKLPGAQHGIHVSSIFSVSSSLYSFLFVHICSRSLWLMIYLLSHKPSTRNQINHHVVA